MLIPKQVISLSTLKANVNTFALFETNLNVIKTAINSDKNADTKDITSSSLKAFNKYTILSNHLLTIEINDTKRKLWQHKAAIYFLNNSAIPPNVPSIEEDSIGINIFVA